VLSAIVGAGVLLGRDVMESGDPVLQANVLIAAGFAFVAAFISIMAMMYWVQRQSYTPFVIYRIVVGAVILWLLA